MSPMNGQWGSMTWATHGLPIMWSMGTCNKLPRGDHIFGPTNAHLGQHGPMYVCHHSANKIPWAPWGACVCASRNTNITGDSKGHLKQSAVARPAKYAETGSCKYLCHAKVTWNKSVVRPRNGQETGLRACDKIIPTHMCLYCNLCRIWHWHYM